MKPEDLAKLILPLLLIPANLYAVSLWGHVAGSLIMGTAFFIALVKFADKEERRFMVILTIFSIIMEGVNVALGSYRYAGVTEVPPWIGLGWAVVGIYLLKIRSILPLSNFHAYAVTALFYLTVWIFTGADASSLVAVAFAILGVYVLSISSDFPAVLFLFAGILGVLIEFLGVTMGVWTYFDAAGQVIRPPYPYLGLSYASIVAFALWAGGKKS